MVRLMVHRMVRLMEHRMVCLTGHLTVTHTDSLVVVHTVDHRVQGMHRRLCMAGIMQHRVRVLVDTADHHARRIHITAGNRLKRKERVL